MGQRIAPGATDGRIGPPTSLRKIVIVAGFQQKGEGDAIDDANLVGIDDDSVDEGPQDLASGIRIGLVQVGTDRFCKAIKAGQRLMDRRLFVCLRRQSLQCRFQVGRSFSDPLQAGFKFVPEDDALGVGVDPAIQALLGVG